MSFFKNKRLRKRLSAGLLALCVASMTPLAASAETVAEIQAEQDRLESEKQELQNKLEQLRNDEASRGGVDLLAQHDYPVVQEPRENVV